MKNSKFQIPNSKFQNLSFKFGLVIMFLLIFSCSPEEKIEINPTDAITNQLKRDLKLDKFESKNISKNLEVNWESVKKIDKNGFEIIEIELSEKNNHKIKSDIFQEKLKYELLSIKSDSISHSYLIEAYSILGNRLYSNSILDLKTFTGTLNLFEINGSPINQIVIYNGRAINPSNNSSLYPLTSFINSFYKTKNTNSKVPACSIVLVYMTESWTDWYRGYQKPSGQIEYVFQHSVYNGSTIQYIATPYSCDAPGDPSASHYLTERTDSYLPVIEDPCDKLNTQNNNPSFKLI